MNFYPAGKLLLLKIQYAVYSKSVYILHDEININSCFSSSFLCSYFMDSNKEPDIFFGR